MLYPLVRTRRAHVVRKLRSENVCQSLSWRPDWDSLDVAYGQHVTPVARDNQPGIASHRDCQDWIVLGVWRAHCDRNVAQHSCVSVYRSDDLRRLVRIDELAQPRTRENVCDVSRSAPRT